MRDEWFPAPSLPITIEQFYQLPQNAAYKYEYFNDQAWLSPRPKFYRALLPLQPCESTTKVDAQWQIAIRPLREDDWEDLAEAFAGAFSRVIPFSSMDDDARLQAARECLEKTRTGGDGPLIRDACFVATVAQDDRNAVSAILVTLVPDKDPSAWNSCRWKEPPPEDAIAQGLGRPHLTWIFVPPLIAGHGVGTALLSNATPQLLRLGYTELSTTFLSGNDSSMLWHWRNGFQLVEYAGSYRRMDRLLRETRQPPEA